MKIYAVYVFYGVYTCYSNYIYMCVLYIHICYIYIHICIHSYWIPATPHGQTFAPSCSGFLLETLRPALLATGLPDAAVYVPGGSRKLWGSYSFWGPNPESPIWLSKGIDLKSYSGSLYDLSHVPKLSHIGLPGKLSTLGYWDSLEAPTRVLVMYFGPQKRCYLCGE